MHAIIGLGNPGAQYSSTRHNAGFRAVDLLGASLQIPISTWKEFQDCLIASGKLGDGAVVLVKPQTFMNRSGSASAPLVRYFKIPVENTIVVHDDVDLEPGILRLKFGGGAGGQKGVEDMISALGSQEFYRVRVGVGHPSRGVDSCPENYQDLSSWVLGSPRPEEKELIEDAVLRASQAIYSLLQEGLTVAQAKFHKRQ